MKLTTLSLCGVKVPVLLKKMRKLDGLWDGSAQIIYVDPRIKKDLFAITLMHEILHAIICIRARNMIQAVKKIKGVNAAEEAIVVPFATGLIDLFKQNPQLRKIIANGNSK